MPFLENVLRGKNVPRERMLAVSRTLLPLRRKKPDQRTEPALIAALEAELKQHGPTFRSIGAIATGIPCWLTRSAK